MWPAPVQEADRAGAARSAMWDIGQARRRTLSASSTGPLGCLSAGISSVGRLNRMPRYAFRRPTLYLPRRKSNAGHIECEKCGLASRRPQEFPHRAGEGFRLVEIGDVAGALQLHEAGARDRLVQL